MDNKDLYKRASELGLTLFEPAGKNPNAYKIFLDIIESNEIRLWEGIPVILANLAKEDKFDYKKMLASIKNNESKNKFISFFLRSLSLYEHLGLNDWWKKNLYSELDPAEKKKVKEFANDFKYGKSFEVSGVTLAPERLKNNFDLYFESKKNDANRMLLQYKDLSLTYALSQIFSPKQRELFLKKLQGKKLTKTEKEYYSRSVKKKVLSLANSELHNLAKELLKK